MARPRKLLVDAYNVLHVTGVLAPEHAGPDLTELAELIAKSRWSALRVRLVCDGASPGPLQLAGRVEAVFAGAGADADSLIEELLRQDSAPRAVRVISSDRRLRIAAQRRRAGWMASEEFLRRLNLDAGRQAKAAVRAAPPLPNEDRSVEGWLERFGVPPDDPLRRLQSAAGRPEGANHNEAPPSSKPDRVPPRAPLDPAIEEALEEWRNRLAPDDLDMSKWISGVDPI